MAECDGPTGALVGAAVRTERSLGQDRFHGCPAEYVGGERRAARPFVPQLSLLLHFLVGSMCLPSILFRI